MSNNQTSVFGAVVVTMCVTAIGLLGGYLAVTEFLGEKPAVTTGEDAGETAAPAPQRRSTQARRNGVRASDDGVVAGTPGEAGAEATEGESSESAAGTDTSIAGEAAPDAGNTGDAADGPPSTRERLRRGLYAGHLLTAWALGVSNGLLGLALFVIFVNFRLRDARIGRAWIAIREDEVAAISMGIPTVRVKLLAYAIGAALGGMAGSFLASYINVVNADQFEFSFSIFVLAMIILGGLGSIWGVVVGALALSFINTRLIPDVLNTVPSKVGLDFDLTQLGFGIFGFLLVIMMVLRPQGLIPEQRRQAELTEGLDGEHTVPVEAQP